MISLRLIILGCAFPLIAYAPYMNKPQKSINEQRDEFYQQLKEYIATPSPKNAQRLIRTYAEQAENKKLKVMIDQLIDLNALSLKEIDTQAHLIAAPERWPLPDIGAFEAPDEKQKVAPTQLALSKKDYREKQQTIQSIKAIIDEKIGESSDSRTLKYIQEEQSRLAQQIKNGSAQQAQKIYAELLSSPDMFLKKEFPRLGVNPKAEDDDTSLIAVEQPGETFLPPKPDVITVNLAIEDKLGAFEVKISNIEEQFNNLKESDPQVPELEKNNQEAKDLQDYNNTLTEKNEEVLEAEIECLQKQTELAEAENDILDFLSKPAIVGGGLAFTAGELLAKRQAADALKKNALELEIKLTEKVLEQAEIEKKIQEKVKARAEKMIKQGEALQKNIDTIKAAEYIAKTRESIDRIEHALEKVKNEQEQIIRSGKYDTMQNERLQKLNNRISNLEERINTRNNTINKIQEFFNNINTEIAYAESSLKSSQARYKEILASEARLKSLITVKKNELSQLTLSNQGKLDQNTIRAILAQASQESEKFQKELNHAVHAEYIEFKGAMSKLADKITDAITITPNQKAMIEKKYQLAKNELSTNVTGVKTNIQQRAIQAVESVENASKKLLQHNQLPQSAINLLNRVQGALSFIKNKVPK